MNMQFSLHTKAVRCLLALLLCALVLVCTACGTSVSVTTTDGSGSSSSTSTQLDNPGSTTSGDITTAPTVTFEITFDANNGTPSAVFVVE